MTEFAKESFVNLMAEIAAGLPQERGINFLSDNATPAHPAIMAAMEQANKLVTAGPFRPYGEDPITERAEQRFSEEFETPVKIAPTLTGTGANSISLAHASDTIFSAIFSHAGAHLLKSEVDGPAHLAGGKGKAIPVDGDHGKIDARELEKVLVKFDMYVLSNSVLSVTQPTENGTVYSLEELTELFSVAKKYNMAIHMDGTRFASAIVALGCSPAEMTWKLGVDVLSFGGTKNGCEMAETVVVFSKDGQIRPDPLPLKIKPDLVGLRKRSGQTNSRTWAVSAQLLAYLHEGFYLRLARNSNTMAQLLGTELKKMGVNPIHEVQANMVFAKLPPDVVKGLAEDDIHFYSWPDGRCRFITNYKTTKAEVKTLVSAIRRRMGLSLEGSFNGVTTTVASSNLAASATTHRVLPADALKA